MIDYSIGSRPGHLGKGVGKQVSVLAHLLLRFRSSSRLEDKRQQKLEFESSRRSGSGRHGWKGPKSSAIAESREVLPKTPGLGVLTQ